MRISDWSSDVCSSDLLAQVAAGKAAVHLADDVGRRDGGDARARAQPAAGGDRQLPQRFAAPGRPGRRPGPGRTRAAGRAHPGRTRPNGRASGRERVCQYVESSVVASSVKKKKKSKKDK